LKESTVAKEKENKKWRKSCVLDKYVTRFDVVLGKIIFGLWAASVSGLFILIFLSKIGIFG